jgi:hypothetical protein
MHIYIQMYVTIQSEIDTYAFYSDILFVLVGVVHIKTCVYKDMCISLYTQI